MGKFNLTALNVRQAALAQKRAGKFDRTPCWTDVVAEIPPASVHVRNRPVQHPITQQRVRTRTDASGNSRHEVVVEQLPSRKRPPKKGSRMFKPLEIRYEEDELRKEFFQDHPWELARPRVVLESDGRDHTRSDWSKLHKKDRRLDGESVIQHQLYLLNNVPDMTKAKAYDIARKEFYKHRLQEEVEQRVAHEEALAVGAYFDQSMLERGMELENQEYERWKKWSEKEASSLDQRIDSLLGVSSGEAAAPQGDQNSPNAGTGDMPGPADASSPQSATSGRPSSRLS